jgi:hypothetical protein
MRSRIGGEATPASSCAPPGAVPAPLALSTRMPSARRTLANWRAA